MRWTIDSWLLSLRSRGPSVNVFLPKRKPAPTMRWCSDPSTEFLCNRDAYTAFPGKAMCRLELMSVERHRVNDLKIIFTVVKPAFSTDWCQHPAESTAGNSIGVTLAPLESLLSWPHHIETLSRSFAASPQRQRVRWCSNPPLTRT